MERLIYKIGDYTTTSFSEKERLEEETGLRGVMIYEEIKDEREIVSPIRRAMLDQFGYVSRKLLPKVVLP